MSINRWMDNEDVVHICNGILISDKKEWNNVICSNMNRHSNYIKWSKKKIPQDITYMWNQKYDTNGLIYETEINLQTCVDLCLPREGIVEDGLGAWG